MRMSQFLRGFGKPFLPAILIVAVFAIVLLSGRAVAQTVSDAEFKALEQRVQYLETLLVKAGISVSSESVTGEVSQGNPDFESAKEQKSESEQDLKAGITYEFNGLLEAETGLTHSSLNAGGSSTNTDIRLKTVQLGWYAKLNERFKGNLVLLWEEDDTEPMDVDEGTITWKNGSSEITVGRLYPSFGTYDTSFIRDPLTLELGEIQETAIKIHTAPSDAYDASVSFANGNVEKKTSGGDRIDDYCLRFDVNPKIGVDKSLTFGFQYLSDIAETNVDLLGVADGPTQRVLEKVVGGYGANVSVTNGPWNLIGEYVGAAGRFDALNLDEDGDGEGDRPAAWNLELAYAAWERFRLAFKYEGSAEFYDMPKSQYGVDGSWDFGDGVSFSLDYLYADFSERFSSADSTRTMLLSKIAFEF
jgi:hypothetical protein